MMDTEKSGYLIEEGDHEGWIQKISLLLEDKELSKRMGKKGREFVLEHFSWETIAKKFLNASKLYINEK